jgi:very-short-patch-repair endonuclease
MQPIEQRIRSSGLFLRRRDLLPLDYTDAQIRISLASHRIFRVRHGWYSVPDAPEAAVRAVRVGGRLTSVSALETYGLPVPHRPALHIAVPATASRLRTADDRRRRLDPGDGVRVHWVDRRGRGGSVWRVSIDDALLATLIKEPRDVAVACASAVMRHEHWAQGRMDEVFRRAPPEARRWRGLVSMLDDSHGETLFRLWSLDAGFVFAQQVAVAGIGRFDFQVGPRTFVEVDGGQHDPNWSDPQSSSWEKDHDWDTSMAIIGNRVLRYTYRQLYRDFPRVLQAVRRAIEDDLAAGHWRAAHPNAPALSGSTALPSPSSVPGPSPSSVCARAQRKRRRSTTKP